MRNFLMFVFLVSILSLTACTSKIADKSFSTKNYEPASTSTGPTSVETKSYVAATTTPDSVTPEISSKADASASNNVVVKTTPLGLANPASTNCIDKEGSLKTVTRADGNQYSVCYFIDNRQCEEWALFRGDCPVGGLKVTGYDNEQQKFCAITGGEVDMAQNSCTFKGKSCDLGKYYDGACSE